jgi:hypothetical protein
MLFEQKTFHDTQCRATTHRYRHGNDLIVLFVAKECGLPNADSTLESIV